MKKSIGALVAGVLLALPGAVFAEIDMYGNQFSPNYLPVYGQSFLQPIGGQNPYAGNCNYQDDCRFVQYSNAYPSSYSYPSAYANYQTPPNPTYWCNGYYSYTPCQTQYYYPQQQNYYPQQNYYQNYYPNTYTNANTNYNYNSWYVPAYTYAYSW